MSGLSYYAQVIQPLADLGWRLLPIPAGQKRPTLQRWQEVATSDEATLRQWWAGAEHNVGLLLGPQPNGDNLVALDIDDREGYSGSDQLDALEEQFGRLPETVESITGSGGRHILFTLPTGMHSPTSVGICDGPGVDTRGVGGQIVLPPSVHPNGRTYEWAEDHSPWDLDVAHAPAWLIELLSPPVRAARPIELGSGPRPIQLSGAELAGHALNRSMSWGDLLAKAGGRFLGQRRAR